MAVAGSDNRLVRLVVERGQVLHGVTCPHLPLWTDTAMLIRDKALQRKVRVWCVFGACCFPVDWWTSFPHLARWVILRYSSTLAFALIYYLRLGHTKAEGGLHVPAVTAGFHRIVTGAGAGAIGTEEVVDAEQQGQWIRSDRVSDSGCLLRG
jgi:hypothetical protein